MFDEGTNFFYKSCRKSRARSEAFNWILVVPGFIIKIRSRKKSVLLKKVVDKRGLGADQ